MLWLSRLKGNDSSHAAGKIIAGYVGCQPARNLSQASCLRTPFASSYIIINNDQYFEIMGITLHDHCRNYLPHFENKQYQMVTFRLYDSVPKEVVEMWKSIIESETLCHEEGGTTRKISNQEKKRRILALIDQYEDSGYGQCLLQYEQAAQIVQNCLFHHNQKKYELICWCIMPNHVHILIETKPEISISIIMHSLRSFTSNEINKAFNRNGKLWMPEFFDRYIRDLYHFEKVVNYIHNNPVKAGLVSDASEYRWSSAKDWLKE